MSNVQSANVEILAPEINFYLNNTLDTVAEKAKNVQLLSAASTAGNDASRDIDIPVIVGKSVLILANEAQDFLLEKLQASGFTATIYSPRKISRLTGEIGAFLVDIQNNDQIAPLKTDHIIWFNAPAHLVNMRGMYDPQVLGVDAVVANIAASTGKIFFKKYLSYDPSICLFHKKRAEICGKCSSYCMFNAIEKDLDTKEIHISVINCTGCGRCVSACPSGALDYTKMPRSSFASICSFYQNKIALVIPRTMNLENITVPLPARVLPLTVENEHFLDESHLLTLLQTSGNPIILYAENISPMTREIASFVNVIYQKKFHKIAVHVCECEVDLGKALVSLVPLAEWFYDLAGIDLPKRVNIAKRLAHVIGDDDLGAMHPGELLDYGNIQIDQEKCTLCLSCAEACCVQAITAHPEDNTLRFNPSICTSCGYCEITCPETGCLQVVQKELSLRPDYFKQNIVATDELLQCSECAKEFAPRKSVEKIAGIMKPFFVNDPVKLKTLHCCPECKARIMIENQLTVRP